MQRNVKKAWRRGNRDIVVCKGVCEAPSIKGLDLSRCSRCSLCFCPSLPFHHVITSPSSCWFPHSSLLPRPGSSFQAGTNHECTGFQREFICPHASPVFGQASLGTLPDAISEPQPTTWTVLLQPRPGFNLGLCLFLCRTVDGSTTPGLPGSG